ncbi:flagellar basal body P-ring formation chaperone FlgA [Chromobacterium vaccinii]|uniref:Flagella basal body P-ring formation protein FlgA n=1 Tax=Chromobacterium vaccinii TaxID=1108595 RepID=A0A1D9LKH1_9NEIS|nr:flagellar basal body P-ring formation chaperone FlgA [Chromobacterium vaccinii]AOZ51711.1 flagella basal body P-ring formation protein FlgA [Chromobacterium vaccinii]QND86832.1 Flagellar basal-body P-ring formation protein FlgA [Chromobacterium vaccinii]QND92063.1 Flagellar basal-body P-ring formation protein FlgA [Chromobacterium vaccinii]
MRRLIIGLCWLLAAGLAWGGGTQDLAQLERLANLFLKRELEMRAATWTLGQLDRRLAVPACKAPKADWATPGVTTGSTFVAVSCQELGWSFRIPVRINEKRLGVVLNRAMAAGETIGGDDVRVVDISNPALASNVLTDASQAVGQVLRTGAPAGVWLRNFMVRAPYLVRSNQRVKVLAQGDGFSAEAEGTALANAAQGEQISVRLSTGRVVRGAVQADGSVAVVF